MTEVCRPALPVQNQKLLEAYYIPAKQNYLVTFTLIGLKLCYIRKQSTVPSAQCKAQERTLTSATHLGHLQSPLGTVVSGGMRQYV